MSKVRVSTVAAAIAALFTGFIGLFLVAILVRGSVFTVLWGWFAVPVFGLPALGIAPALGLSMLFNYLFSHKKEAQSLADIFLGALVTLGVGWVIHLFM